MHRLTRPLHMILGGLIVLALSGVALATHETPSLEQRVANIEATLGISYDHEEPTEVPPTATHEHEPPVAIGNTWHAPGAHDGLPAHEHGAAPPQWVTDFSMANFGHGLIYGGDEGTPRENELKHWAFKGYSVTFDGVSIYLRNHMQGNPMGHMARYHSYEVYAKDAAGNVSFWQGWLDFALPGETVPNIKDGGCENDTQRPIMGVNKVGCGAYEFESWYSRPGGPNGFWTWDTGVNIQAPYYHDAADPMDQSTWHRAPDGNLGLTRRVELAWYADRASQVPRNTWFCTTPEGAGIGLAEGNRPDGCAEGLPQYIASTMTTVSFPGNSSQTTYPGAGVVGPLN